MPEVRDFLFPDLGEGLTEGEIVDWLVAVGDRVVVDQPIAEVTTEKAAVQVPVPFAGVVVTLHGEPGSIVQVGAPLISIDVGAPAGAGAEAEPTPGVHTEPGTVRSAAPGSGNVLVGYGTTGDQPRRRPRVRTGGGGESGTPRTASPRVRHRAAESGVDLGTVAATGPGGAVSEADLERHLRDGATGGPGASAPAGERVRLTGIRRLTAERLTRSHSQAPDATAWLSVDATALLDLRASLNAEQQAVHVTPLAVVLSLCVPALRAFPALNAHLDPTTGDTLLSAAVHLGVAVQAPQGLLVPVLRDAQDRSVIDIATELNRLAAAARDGSIAAAEMGGSSFTISNFGAFGVDGGAAIINPPEAGILGVGRITQRAWVDGAEVVARPVMELSLVFDHRACDGGTAGGFLRLLGDLVEHSPSAGQR